MRALVVGAGAVGRVYGRHLALGGAEVSFLVKEAHLEACRRGFTFYPLNRRGEQRREPVGWRAYGLLVEREIASTRWDEIYLATSSTALRDRWIGRLAETGEATVVLLQPGPDDRARLQAVVGPERLVQGVLSLLAYAAPLPGETRFPRPGIAYWFPPAAAPFDGPPDRRAAVVRALRAGGLPARAAADATREAAFATATMMPLLVALEAAGWSFARLFSAAERPRLRTAFAAAREARAVVARTRGRRPPPLLALLARPLPLRLAIAAGRRTVPLDLETYLSVHFTKVGDQTRALIGDYLAHARALGIDAPNLEAIAREAPTPPGR